MIAEQDKQKILAANLERDRISTNIQSEVTATLNSVIDQTISGLRMLDEAKAHGEEPSAESIASAFAAIGSQGREALAICANCCGYCARPDSAMRLMPASPKRCGSNPLPHWTNR